MPVFGIFCISLHRKLMSFIYEQDQGTGQQIPDTLQIPRG